MGVYRPKATCTDIGFHPFWAEAATIRPPSPGSSREVPAGNTSNRQPRPPQIPMYCGDGQYRTPPKPTIIRTLSVWMDVSRRLFVVYLMVFLLPVRLVVVSTYARYMCVRWCMLLLLLHVHIYSCCSVHGRAMPKQTRVRVNLHHQFPDTRQNV